MFLTKLGFAQLADIKALRLKENTLKGDTNEVIWHYNLSRAYRMLNNDSSIYAAQRGILLAKKIHFDKGEGWCYSSIAVGYAIKGVFKDAVENCQKAIEINKATNPGELGMNYSQMGLMLYSQGKISQAIHYQNMSLKYGEKYKDKKVQRQSHNNIGIIYISTGEYLRANDHFYKTLKLAEEMKDTMVIATACINISEIYQEQKDYKRALEFTNRALQLNRNSKNAVLTVVAYITIGTIHAKLGNQQEAITQFQKALKLAKEAAVDSRLGECYTNLGMAYLALGKHEKALNFLLQAKSLDKAENNNAALSGDYIGLSKVYEKINKPELQVKYALQALKLAEIEHLKPKIRDAAESLYMYYKKQANAGLALTYLELYTRYKDSLFNVENIKQLKAAEYKYAKESQRKEIQLLKNKNELTKKENNLQRIYLYGSFLVCLAAIGFIFYYLRQIRIKNKLFDSLRDKNEHIEEQSMKLEDLNLVKNKVISVMSHDMRSPIASLEMILSMEKELSDPDIFRMMMKELKPAVNSLSLLLENILGWAKSQMQSSQEISLIPVNVCTTVEEIITLYTPMATQKSVALINEVAAEAWVSANQSYLTLVLRNLVSNAIKFSPAGEAITISTTATDEFVSITVADQGIGMTEKEIGKLFNVNSLYTSNGTKNEKGTGLGLIFVKESVELCGGSLTIKSQKNKGSRFTCRFPVAIPESDFVILD